MVRHKVVATDLGRQLFIALSRYAYSYEAIRIQYFEAFMNEYL